MDLKVLAALLLTVGLTRGSESELEYGEVQVELNADVKSHDSRVIKNARDIVNITSTEESNCINDNGGPRYSHSETTVWSYDGCHVKLTVVFIKQSTIFCVDVTHDNTSVSGEVLDTLDPGNGFIVGQIVSMTVVTLFSDPGTCIFKASFYYFEDTIHILEGCRAVFKVCYLRAPINLCVVKRVGGGNVTLTFPGKILLYAKIVITFGNCTSNYVDQGTFNAVDCAGIFLFCFLPIDLHCDISEDPRVHGFDNQIVNVTEPCMYNAVFYNLNYLCSFGVSVKVTTDPTTGVARLTYVKIATLKIKIILDKDTLTVDDTAIEAPAVVKRICFKKYNGFIEITLRCGIIIKWKGRLGLLKIWAPPCFSASVFGLCGNANWDRSDDLATPLSNHIVYDTSPNPSGLPQCDPWGGTR